MMYKNEGLSINNRQSGIESLAEDILRGDFYRIGPLATDARQLLAQFCAEGHLAVRENYGEDERKRQCDWVVETASEAVFLDIVPEVFGAVVYGQEGEWEPMVDEDVPPIAGLPCDLLVIYLEGLPLAVSVFSSETDLEESEEADNTENVVYIEQIQAVYVDEGVVSQLNLSKEEVGVYLEMLISKTMERFTFDDESARSFRPTITVAKNQEGYFEAMAEEYLWGRTEQEAGYVIFN